MNRALNQDILERIAARFTRLYPNHDLDALMRRFDAIPGRYEIAVDPATAAAPPARWSERDAALITYGDSIVREGDWPLLTLKRFVDQHLEDAISIVHLLPFFPYSSDDGFSVINYRAVRPDLGEWQDIRAVGEHHDLMYDLVINHASRRGEWFKHYLLDVAPYRGFFIEADPAADLSAVVRPRDLPLLSEVKKRGSTRHLWTTFSRDQVDLNFANPDVLFEFIDILLYYIAQRVRVVRLDAIAYLWKKPGTPCIHLPETHEVVKLLRDVVDLLAPGVILLTETNVPHAENVAYFGDGDEAHMVYQFPLPPLLLHALLNGSAAALTRWAAGLAAPPPGCTFFNFTASHDGIGVRPLEGLVPPAEVDALLAAVTARGGQVSRKRNADGSTSPYELNITWFAALGPAEGGAEDPHHLARFLASQIIAAGLAGVPAFYLHALTASPNDTAGVAETGRARSINRRRWPADELEANLADPATPTARALSAITALLKVRAGQPAFHPEAPQQALDLGSEVFAFVRGGPRHTPRLLALHNVTDREIEVNLPDEITPAGTDLLEPARTGLARGPVPLAPYQCRWLPLAE